MSVGLPANAALGPAKANPAFPPGFGINLVGTLGHPYGLCGAAESIAEVLRARAVPLRILNLNFDFGRPQFPPQLVPHIVESPGELVHPINLYVLSNWAHQRLLEQHPTLVQAGRFHVANLWWESTRLPQRDLPALARFDAALAMSNFVAEVCRNCLPLTPIISGNYPIALPAAIRRDRAEFNLPADTVLFVASLDPNSDVSRKNPGAVITAFRAAFPPGDAQVRLVIRLNNAHTDIGRQAVNTLAQLAQADRRIHLLIRPMRRDEILALFACADVYVSMHRAEGLGLGMLESMVLGKPVIATGWSGNMSFMNHGNSALLRYKLGPAVGSTAAYKADSMDGEALWATPVLEDAVAWMRQLRRNPGLRQRMGAAARAATTEYRRQAHAAPWLQELAALWQAWRMLPRASGKLSSGAGHPASRVGGVGDPEVRADVHVGLPPRTPGLRWL